MTATIPSGFEGFCVITANLIMPTIVPIGPVAADRSAEGPAVALIRTPVYSTLADVAELTIDPTKGHVFNLLVACDGLGRAGVSFTHEPPSGDPFFLIGFEGRTVAFAKSSLALFPLHGLDSCARFCKLETVRRSLVALLCVISASCSVVIPADQVQCESAEDCVARGFPTNTQCDQQLCVAPAIDPIWGCLGNVEEPVPVPGETHLYSLMITDALTGAPPPGLAARLCSSVDLNCDEPIIEDVSITEDGRMNATIASGFQGFFEVTSDVTMPTLLPVGPVVADSPADASPLALARELVLESLAGAVGVTIDPAKGHVFALFAACDGHGRAGVSFTHEPAGGTRFFLIGLTPDLDTLTSDEDGNGGVLNLEPGFVTMTSILHETGEFIGRARTLIRPHTITYVNLGPTAAP